MLKLIKSKFVFIAGGVIFIVLLLFGILFVAAKNNQKAQAKKVTAQTTQVVPKKEIGKEIEIKSSTKAKIEIKYLIDSAELLDEISVKGEKVKAASGRTFLVFNLKITNAGKQGIQVNSRDFVRLMITSKEEWLAPDIHNDPVEVQAIATKYTRVGFPVNKTDKNFKVRVGQIDGEKEEFEVNF